MGWVRYFPRLRLVCPNLRSWQIATLAGPCQQGRTLAAHERVWKGGDDSLITAHRQMSDRRLPSYIPR